MDRRSERRLHLPDRQPFYKRTWVRIAAVVVAIPVLSVAWWLGSPLFIDEVVDEPFPRAAMAVIPDGMTASEVEQEMMEAESVDAVIDDPMPEPPASVAVAPAVTVATTEGPEEGQAEDAPPSTGTSTAAVEERPEQAGEQAVHPDAVGPVAVVTGALVDGDSFHKGSGAVTLYRLEDDSLLLRMEDIAVTNGPQLHVYLISAHGVHGRDEVQAHGYVDLGGLKGNIGSQNYEVPAGYEIPEELTVVVYCVPFQVVFATAELA